MENCCIWLVICLNYTMMHGHTNLKNKVNNYFVWAKCNVLLELTVLSLGEEILGTTKATAL
jgi:hypothetical protein